MNKILRMIVCYDLGAANDTQVDLVKAAILAGFDDTFKQQVSFEVETQEEIQHTHRLIQQVRAEFRKQDRRR